MEIPEWQMSSDIYYLLNTVKINYDSPLGKVTLENIDTASIDDCLQTLQNLASAHYDEDGTRAPFVITVCGVTWDYLTSSISTEKQTIRQRIRAIPKAAGFRFFADSPKNSDAYFYQANQLKLDCTPSDYFSDRLVGEAKSVCQLTLSQFINQLHYNNRQFIQSHGQALHLRKEHFDETMTQHEQNMLSRFSPLKTASVDLVEMS